MLRNIFFVIATLPLVVGLAALPQDRSILFPVAKAAGTVQFQLAGSNDGFAFWGGTGSNTAERAFNYKAQNDQYVCSVAVYLRKDGSPTDNIFVQLYTDSDNSLTTYGVGSLLNTSDVITGSGLTTSDTLQTFSFDNCQLLTGTSNYTFVFTRSGTFSDTNKYGMAYTTGTPSPTVIRSMSNAAGWVLDTNTRLVTIYGYESLEILTIPSTSTLLAGLTTGLASKLEDCTVYNGGFFSSSTLQALGCFARNTAETFVDILFIPSASSTGNSMFRAGLESFKSVFPFNIFFNFASVVADNSSNYSVTDNSIQINLPSPTPGTFNINSSTLSGAVGSTTWSTIRTYETHGIWFITGLAILLTIIL